MPVYEEQECIPLPTHIELERDRLQWRTDRRPPSASSGRNASMGHARRRLTHIKVIALAHLFPELALGPLRDLGPPLVVEPAVGLDGPDDPPRLGLALEDVAESGVVAGTPHGKVQAEEEAGGRAGEGDEEDELEAEEEQRQEVDVLSERGMSVRVRAVVFILCCRVVYAKQNGG